MTFVPFSDTNRLPTESNARPFGLLNPLTNVDTLPAGVILATVPPELAT